ncbi:MAG TPA: hypothetical protein VFO60_05735 [Candidatus Dormibacteraeota bacterium]|nr:hypothetical protein [Candidatus Dormibacteraeota bacterium]
MADERTPRPSFRDRDRRGDGFVPRPSGTRPSFGPRPGGFVPGAGAGVGAGPPRPPAPVRPAPEAVTIRLRDGEREVELHGSLPACRQLLEELPALWSRLRPAAVAAGPARSIALPPVAPALRESPPPPVAAVEEPAVQDDDDEDGETGETAAITVAPRESRAAGRAPGRQRHEKPRSAPVSQAREARRPPARANGAVTLEGQVIGVLRTAGRPVGIAEIRSHLSEDVSGQAVRRILERSEEVANVGGRPAAYRLR